MKRIMIGEENMAHGVIERASAAQYIYEGIYGYLLTPEEAEDTCFAGCSAAICSTCDPAHCTWYEER